MTTEAEFASVLARALGPLYRVSVAGSDGRVEASFGQLSGDRSVRSEIPLPGSTRTLVVELQAEAVEAATRVLGALGPQAGSAEVPAGSFTHVNHALGELISLAEAQIGQPLSQMSRAEKQRVVRFLDERGAFTLRKSVEMVADALGVSRFTVYNYLDSSRQG